MAVKDGLPATDFSRMNREWVKAVAEGGSGGGGLPEITEADEGKVLTVESGEAAWATAGGGGGGSVLLINNNDETLNKTGQQIADAFTGGSLCLLVNQISEDDYTDTFYSIMAEYAQSISESEGNYYNFTFIRMVSGNIVTSKYSCTALSDNPTAVY